MENQKKKKDYRVARSKNRKWKIYYLIESEKLDAQEP